MLLHVPQRGFAVGALLVFTQVARSQTITDTFDVDAGCAIYRTGQPGADLDNYFLEAQAITNAAINGFWNYNTRPDARQTAKTFFNINAAAQTAGPADQTGIDRLNSVVGWFDQLASFVNAQPPRPYVKLFCDTNWFEGPTTQLYNAQGNPIAGTIPAAYPQVPELATGDKVPYWAAQFRQYWFVDRATIDKMGEPSTWLTKVDAVTAELSGGTKTLTLSPQELLQDNDMLERVPIAGARMGDFLDEYQAKSLTLVHEMFHITQGGFASLDLSGYTYAGLDPNTGAPTFTESENAADTVEECMGLADNIQAAAHQNPQNLAWAALATYLFQETGLQWSSGSAIAPIQGRTQKTRRELGERLQGYITNIAGAIKARSKLARAFKG